MIECLPSPALKPLVWVGAAYAELMDLPASVRRAFGYALHFAQAGEKHDHAKPLKGFKGAGVLEVVVVEDDDGNTFRAVYTVKFQGVVYLLHCFQKKSTRGIATPQPTLELIKKRLQQAAAIHQAKE
jgi:phage-related protein